MGCAFSSLPQFPGFPLPSLGTREWWETEGSEEGTRMQATWPVWFLDIWSLRWLWDSPINLAFIFCKKTVEHFHFSIIYFLDHPRQFKILGWLPFFYIHRYIFFLPFSLSVSVYVYASLCDFVCIALLLPFVLGFSLSGFFFIVLFLFCFFSIVFSTC